MLLLSLSLTGLSSWGRQSIRQDQEWIFFFFILLSFAWGETAWPIFFFMCICNSFFNGYLCCVCSAVHTKFSQLLVRISDGWRLSCLLMWFQRRRKIFGKERDCITCFLFFLISEKIDITGTYVNMNSNYYYFFFKCHLQFHHLLQAVLHWRVQVMPWRTVLFVHKHYVSTLHSKPATRIQTLKNLI